jgi:soluble lytic murein transglycosylase
MASKTRVTLNAGFYCLSVLLDARAVCHDSVRFRGSVAKLDLGVYWTGMRGRGSLRTRALAIWAGMVGAVLAASGHYSFAQTPGTGETGDQTALAVPRVSLGGATGVGVPQPLPPSEAALVRRIFTLQDTGAVAEAIRDTSRLGDSLLLGSVLADRYLHTSYRAGAPELTAWLAKYGDQPEASTIRDLLDRLSPEAGLSSIAAAGLVRRAASAGRTGASPGQVRLLFVQNRDEQAVRAATTLLAGAQPSYAEALFVGGLASWRQQQSDTATEFFDAAYRVAQSPAVRAASAFWAGHVQQHLGNRGAFAVWMRRAALEGDTFYAMIARRALGPAAACMAGDAVGNADIDALLATPQGKRAFALLQVGQKPLAGAELRALWVDTAQDGVFDRSLALAAKAVGFGQLAAEIEQNGAARPDTPMPSRLQPASGFLVDPPLVYALVRHESNFRSSAVSAHGARGLMQIMPRTAHAVAGSAAERLQDPAVNLSIGQQYLLTLAADDAIDGNLIRLLAGYGQGQGALRKWVDDVRDNGDPLLFIEAIPAQHTRQFIQDALVYSWQYASAMRLPATSLDALAAGQYPLLVRAGRQTSATVDHVCRIAAAGQ